MKMHLIFCWLIKSKVNQGENGIGYSGTPCISELLSPVFNMQEKRVVGGGVPKPTCPALLKIKIHVIKFTKIIPEPSRPRPPQKTHRIIPRTLYPEKNVLDPCMFISTLFRFLSIWGRLLFRFIFNLFWCIDIYWLFIDPALFRKKLTPEHNTTKLSASNRYHIFYTSISPCLIIGPVDDRKVDVENNVDRTPILLSYHYAQSD